MEMTLVVFILFTDAESFDSGMSLTNPIDLRNTEPEFRVFTHSFFYSSK